MINARNMDKLLTNSTDQLSQIKPMIDENSRRLAGVLLDELMYLLVRKNGFYAFESALHVFSSNSCDLDVGVDCWNNSSLWRSEYDDMANGCLFFAEDLFGDQFCIKNNAVHKFDSETGSVEFISDNLFGWSDRIMSDYHTLTGYSVAHEWQARHGIIPIGSRLLPKIPFVAGGDYGLENLVVCDAVESMKYKASIARQIRSLPDGSKIRFEITK